MTSETTLKLLTSLGWDGNMLETLSRCGPLYPWALPNLKHANLLVQTTVRSNGQMVLCGQDTKADIPRLVIKYGVPTMERAIHRWFQRAVFAIADERRANEAREAAKNAEREAKRTFFMERLAAARITDVTPDELNAVGEYHWNAETREVTSAGLKMYTPFRRTDNTYEERLIYMARLVQFLKAEGWKLS